MNLLKLLFLLSLFFLLAACTSTLDASTKLGAVTVDSPDIDTINPNPPPAPPPGLTLNSDCVPDVGQWLPAELRCQAGLTCRIRGAHSGVCLPIGPLPAGALTSSESECGANMTWFSNQLGQAQCALICFPPASGDRCKVPQRCVAFINDELGICHS